MIIIKDTYRNHCEMFRLFVSFRGSQVLSLEYVTSCNTSNTMKAIKNAIVVGSETHFGENGR